jgi:hypothetical protein
MSVPRTKSRLRVQILEDESIVLLRGDKALGAYDEAALDLEENLERLRAMPPARSWRDRLSATVRRFVGPRQPNIS